MSRGEDMTQNYFRGYIRYLFGVYTTDGKYTINAKVFVDC